MAKLFVSYSRRDSVAARKLIEGIKSIGQDVWLDRESIPPGEDWHEQILRGIEESDAFIFLISPDSIASEELKMEINRAAVNNKRIIPIVLRDVTPKDTPENIRRLNWTFLRDTDRFEEGMAKVKTAIELDLDWLEEHRRLQVRALEWHRKKDINLLLRGSDLRNAQRMVETATSKDPSPTELQKTFILQSSRNKRNRTIAWTATGLALIIMLALSLIAGHQSEVAQANQQAALANQQAALANARLAEAHAQLAVAEAQFNHSEAQLVQAQIQLAEAQTQVVDVNTQFVAAQNQLSSLELELASAKTQLAQTPRPENTTIAATGSGTNTRMPSATATVSLTNTPPATVTPNRAQTLQAAFSEIDRQFQTETVSNIAFNKPTRMKKEQTASIELLLSPSFSESALATQLIERGSFITSTADPAQLIAPGGEAITIETGQIEITPRIKAVLSAPDSNAFTVKEMHEAAEQVVSSVEPTSWRWSITAHKEGPQTLELTIYRLVKYDGKEFWHDVETYKADIVVEVTSAERFKSVDWKWLATFLIAVVGAVVAILNWLNDRDKKMQEEEVRKAKPAKNIKKTKK